MTDWALLESVEGLEEPPASARAGAIWELLQGEKEQLCRDLCANGPVVFGNGVAPNEREPDDNCSEEIRWRYRDQLESQLREIIDAQDRLLDGCYGTCSDCGKQIAPTRLLANPTATLCVACQQSTEPEFVRHTI